MVRTSSHLEWILGKVENDRIIGRLIDRQLHIREVDVQDVFIQTKEVGFGRTPLQAGPGTITKFIVDQKQRKIETAQIKSNCVVGATIQPDESVNVCATECQVICRNDTAVRKIEITGCRFESEVTFDIEEIEESDLQGTTCLREFTERSVEIQNSSAFASIIDGD